MDRDAAYEDGGAREGVAPAFEGLDRDHPEPRVSRCDECKHRCEGRPTEDKRHEDALSVFDGEADIVVPLDQARAYVAGLSGVKDLLLCWDAPLTGPPAEVLRGGEAYRAAFTKRPIERFFSIATTGFQTPTGISVQGYAGCQHWTLSRSLVGLPRTGPFDAAANQLPFRLAKDDVPPSRGRWIVEVHPALALWLWCSRKVSSLEDWEYKKNKATLLLLASMLAETAFTTIPQLVSVPPPRNDDELDARIAFALGTLWMRESPGASLLGGPDVGAFLLPDDPTVVDAFRRFLASEGDGT